MCMTRVGQFGNLILQTYNFLCDRNKLSFWRYDKSYENVVDLYNVPRSNINVVVVVNGMCIMKSQ
jgi:hypothetical protein